MADRVEPDAAADERTTLEQFLRYYRDTLEMTTDGVSDAAGATASCPPSTLTLGGLVRHMADVERNCFRRCFAGEDVPPIFSSPDRPDADLEVESETSLADSIAAWRWEIDQCDRILARVADLGELSAVARDGHHPSMRRILVSLTLEYARRCGHADLIRERLDGTVGD